MKKLLILGGFPQMIDIAMTAKSMGIFVLIADREPTSPAKRFANRAVDISTDHIDDLAALCRAEGIDGVFTGFEDFNIHIARELCTRLNLPFYATEEQLAIVTDKLCFKDACRRYGVPVIEQYTYETAQAEENYPYIVKPSDSYGSRGITVCQWEEELHRGYKIAIAASPSGSAVIERFIDYDHGTELFYTVVNGHIHLTATADRYTVKNGITTVPLPVAEVFPSRHEQDMKTRLDPAIRKMIEGLNIQNGPILIQALFDGHDYYIYEMAYRLTGEQHYRLIEKQHGIHLGKMMIRLALGEDIGEYDTPLLDIDAFRYPSVNLAVILKPGTIARIEGLQKVYQIDEVISYNLTHAERDVIQASGNYSHMLIRINMVAKTYEKLRTAVHNAGTYIKVTDEDGKDMLVTWFELPREG